LIPGILILELILLASGLWLSLSPFSDTRRLILSVGILAGLALSLFAIPSTELFQNNLVWDKFSLYFSLLILLSSLFACLLRYGLSRRILIGYRKYLLLVFTASAMLIFLAGTLNFIYFLVVWSLLQLLFYQLIEEPDSRLAWNYLVLEAVSTSVLLIGLVILFRITGAVNLAEIKTNLVLQFFQQGPPGKILTVSLVFITVALVFKLGLFPFYFWLGSFHRKTSLIPYSFFSLLLRLGLLAFTIRFWLRSVIIYPEYWQFVLIAAGAGSILWGSLALWIAAGRGKTWLYLDLIQLGFLAGAIAVADFAGLWGGLFYLGVYVFGFWGLAFGFAAYGQDEFDFKNLFIRIKRNRLWLVGLAVCLGSLIGLPLTAGFWGKYNLISTWFKQDWRGLAWVALASSLFLLFYFALIYIRQRGLAAGDSDKIPQTLAIGFLACCIILFWFGLFPEVVLDLVLPAAATIPF
jgi:NADH-quinone oxidoreductase subunit N